MAVDGRPDNYWTEEGALQISQRAEKELLEATYELHNMTLEAVDRVVKDDVMMELFEIPRDMWPAVRKSWEMKQSDMLGRMDFAWDGKGPPKLLEYNGDTPSVLVESGAASLSWMEEMRRSSIVNVYSPEIVNNKMVRLPKQSD